MSAGVQAQAIVFEAIEPFVKVGDNLSEQKSLAYAVFRIDDRRKPWPAGQSKIDEAFKGRCGAPTKQAIEDRARALGLLKERSAEVARLESMAEMLREQDGEFNGPQIEALEWAVRQLG